MNLPPSSGAPPSMCFVLVLLHLAKRGMTNRIRLLWPHGSIHFHRKTTRENHPLQTAWHTIARCRRPRNKSGRAFQGCRRPSIADASSRCRTSCSDTPLHSLPHPPLLTPRAGQVEVAAHLAQVGLVLRIDGERLHGAAELLLAAAGRALLSLHGAPPLRLRAISDSSQSTLFCNGRTVVKCMSAQQLHHPTVNMPKKNQNRSHQSSTAHLELKTERCH